LAGDGTDACTGRSQPNGQRPKRRFRLARLHGATVEAFRLMADMYFD
jgi:hypothetical protein